MGDLTVADVEEVALPVPTRYYLMERQKVPGGIFCKRVDGKLFDTPEEADEELHYLYLDYVAGRRWQEEPAFPDLVVEATSCDCQDPERGLKSAYCWEHR